MAYQGGKESCRPNETIIAYWYSMSMITLSVLFAWGWGPETRKQNAEGRKKEFEMGAKAKLIKAKRLSERQWQPCKLRKDGRRAAYLESSLGRAVAGAVQHAKVCAPRAHGLAVLVGHNP